MPIYLTELVVSPKDENSIYKTAEKITAFCLIKSVNDKAALSISYFEVETDRWDVKAVIRHPTIVSKESFTGRDIGLEQFNKADKYGRAILYVAVDSRVSELTVENIDSDDGNIGYFFKTKNELVKNGKCLHFNAGEECDFIINAHSVQKSQSLTAIAKDSHIYALANKIELDGNLTVQKKSIQKFSIFRGFCKYHDNRVFEPIDNAPLEPNSHQAALYAYRSLCRELYVKENALTLFDKQLSELKENNRTKRFISDLKAGTENGLRPLRHKKLKLDQALKDESYQSIRYVALECNNPPVISFSGIFYPEFDFQGRPLQDLSVIGQNFSLMTFCSAPTHYGWAVIFSWHNSDDHICMKFINSLKELVKSSSNLGDAVFRLVITCCENVAYSPDWWESLDAHTKDELTDTMRINSDPWIPITHSYLMSGLEDIVQWEFNRVYSSYE